MKKKILIFMSCLLATCYVNAQTNERISRAEDITTGWYRVKCTVAASSEAAYVGCYWLNAEKEFEQNASSHYPILLQTSPSTPADDDALYYIRIEKDGTSTYVQSTNGHYVENHVFSTITPYNVTFSYNDNGFAIGPGWRNWPTLGNIIGLQAASAGKYLYDIYPVNPSDAGLDVWQVLMTGITESSSQAYDHTQVSCTTAGAKGLTKVYNKGYLFFPRGTMPLATDFTVSNEAPEVTINAEKKTITLSFDTSDDEPVKEFTAYRIVNANGRGAIYYSPDYSSEFVWSTGKNESNTDAENYQWVFVKSDDGDYYIYNVGRRAFIEPSSSMGNFSGQTWVFTQNKVGVTLTSMGGNNYSLRTTKGNVYMSVSNSYTGPLISYYAVGDGGVPFYFVKGEPVSDEVKDNIINGNHSLLPRDVSVKQGYQTVGRNNDKALLLRVGIPGNLPGASLDKLIVALKDNTLANVASLKVYQTNNQEFYAEANPSLVGEVTPMENVAEIPLNGYVLQNGSNYLWLTASIKDDATLGDYVDAILTQVVYTFEGTSQTLDIPTTIGDPNGKAQIFNIQSFAYVPTTDDCRFYRIPAMILDKEGNIVVASDRRYGSNSDLGNHKIDVSIRRSEDGGKTWSKQNIIAVGDGKTTSDFGYGDPALARTKNGRLICVMAAGSTMYWNGMRNAAICLSDDNGITWTKPRQLYTSKFTDAVNGKTNEFGFYGNFISSGKGLTTFDGTVMFTNNCLTYENKTSPQCYILSSKDEGETWTIGPSNAYKGCDESKLEQLNDGRLMVSVRQSGDRGFNTGTADASQWSSQWRNSQITGNACNADILYFSRATEGKMDILLHTYIKSSSRENLTLAMSIDQGLTWHDVLNIQPGGSCYSTMIKLANDDLAILYEDESYSVGNGYALNFVTITREQIEAFARQLGAEDEGDAYQRAMQSLQDGGVYMISTSFLNDKETNGSFYLKADGTLTEEESEAKFFTFQCKPIANGFKAAGWKSGQFTNPTNISTNTQFIRRDTQNRNDWEAQVILQDEETDLYAIRATNAPTENTWGANAFWTTDAEGHATYDLKGGEHYIWKIVKVGDTPTFDETQTYRIRSCEQGGYLIINNDGNLGGYYAGWDVYAQDFTIQPVANELGAFTIKDAHANRYIGTPNDKGEWNMSTTASPCRIQRIEADGKIVYYIQAPFSYGYANASLHCLAYPVEEIAGDFGVVSYAKNGKECHWDILTTEEALALNVKNPSSVDENQDIFIFSPSGIRLTKMQRGFNIVRQKNGQVMKYMMK